MPIHQEICLKYRMMQRGIFLGIFLLLLSGCEKLGIEDPAKIAERIEAEGKAIGGACRHAGRAIEDCYELNPRASKAAVFNGWREMNDYMVQNKMDVLVPVIPNAEEKKRLSLDEHGGDVKKSTAKKVEKKEEKKEEKTEEVKAEEPKSKRRRRDERSEVGQEVKPEASATAAKH